MTVIQPNVRTSRNTVDTILIYDVNHSMSQIKYCQLSQQFGRLDTVPKCVRQTDKQADRQTDRQTDGLYFALRVRIKKEKK